MCQEIMFWLDFSMFPCPFPQNLDIFLYLLLVENVDYKKYPLQCTANTDKATEVTACN